jgi:hypothetical protein
MSPSKKPDEVPVEIEQHYHTLFQVESRRTWRFLFWHSGTLVVTWACTCGFGTRAKLFDQQFIFTKGEE